MLEKDVLIKLVDAMTNDLESNKKKLRLHFGNIKLVNGENKQTLLHIFVDEKYDEEKCFEVIRALLAMGVNPNHIDDLGYNFIQLALYTGYSEEFMLKIATEAFKYGLNPNHQDTDKDTAIHSAIYSEDYFGKIDELLKLYIQNGFNVNLICQMGYDVPNAMLYMNKYIKENGIKMPLYKTEEIKSVRVICTSNASKKILNMLKGQTDNVLKNKSKDSNEVVMSDRTERNEIPLPPQEIKKDVVQPKVTEISSSLIKELEKYGTVLNSKKFTSSCAVGREKEILRLMVSLAKENSTPMLIGKSGVGKTAIADELAYRISIGAVPKFLQGKIVLEINPETLASNTKYTGEFEAKVLDLMRLVEENDVILLINEIHTIYGVGSSENNDRDLASIIKKYIDRNKIKVIGTTTKEEYTHYFSSSALKRRFDTVNVEEPSNELLYTILEKVMIDYTIKKGINFKDESVMHKIIEALIEVTQDKNRKYDDKLCNPALSISIIDEAFANALVFEDEYIEEHHFIRAIEWCERIYPASKEKTIVKLKEQPKDKPIARVIQFKK